MAMRTRAQILAEVQPQGGDPEDVNRLLQLEVMLDVRQISAANFVVMNGGTLPTPPWLEDIAKGA